MPAHGPPTHPRRFRPLPGPSRPRRAPPPLTQQVYA
jgi:hypothetical protein